MRTDSVLLDPTRRYSYAFSMRDDGTMVHTIAYADRPVDGARCAHVSLIQPKDGFENGMPGSARRKTVERYQCRKDAIRVTIDGVPVCQEHLG